MIPIPAAAAVSRPTPVPPRRGAAALALVAVLAASGCGGGGSGKSSQVAAKVNDDEVSVHQLNFALQRVPNVPPERGAEVRREILERLIDQELVVRRALDAKLDRDPGVVQALEAARREVLARAHLERVAAQVPKPTQAEIDAFVRENPLLFGERRVWRLNEIVLPSRPANWDRMSKAMESARSAAEAADVLRRNGIDSAVATNVARASEGLPLDVLPRFAKLRDGDVAIFATGAQFVIAEIRSSSAAPLDPKQAAGPTEAYLVSRRRAEALQAEIRRLRETARIAYRGEFEAGAPKPPAPKPAAPAGDAGTLEKGLGGLK